MPASGSLQTGKSVTSCDNSWSLIGHSISTFRDFRRFEGDLNLS